MRILKETKNIVDISEDLGMGGIEEICDHCLGRQFGLRSTGLTNKERGRSLRICLAMQEDIDFKEYNNCWICGEIFEDLDFWKEKAIDSVKKYEFKSFLVGNKTPPLIEENEELLKQKKPNNIKDTSEKFSREFNRELGKKIEKNIDQNVEFDNPDIVIITNIQDNDIEVQVSPIYIYGRYRKLKRGIPQTKWPCRECDGKGCSRCGGTGKMYEESVEETISPPIISVTLGKEVKFHGAGREDVDALMLGNGRPFIIEVKNPEKRTLDLKKIERKINNQSGEKVEVEGLRFADREEVEKIKNLRASKLYRAIVIFQESVEKNKVKNAIQKIKGKIQQRTPQRVAHRRSDKTREREVYKIEGKQENNKKWKIEIKGEAGLYVKELISGDNNRTKPNLSSLIGVKAEVDELDVLKVEGGLKNQKNN